MMKNKAFSTITLLLILQLSQMLQAQTLFGNKGLLTIPTAEMNSNGTFMGGGNYLPRGIIDSPKWKYNSWNYYVNATILPFWDVGFRFTGLKTKSGKFNQDRSVYTKVRLLKEARWYPSLAFGCEDLKIARFNDNNHHMKIYGVATKNFYFSGHEIDLSLGYTYRKRGERSHLIQGGILYSPAFDRDLRFLFEYDGRYANAGVQYLLFRHLALTAGTFRFRSFTGGAALLFKIR